MLYFSHGLGEDFVNYADYYNGHQDDNAICYLTLANDLIHQVKVNAITIAEDVSGMPGIAAKIEDGGYGFDYRMAMNIPDYWIRTIKDKIDEDWKPSGIFWEVTNRRKMKRLFLTQRVMTKLWWATRPSFSVSLMLICIGTCRKVMLTTWLTEE